MALATNSSPAPERTLSGQLSSLRSRLIASYCAIALLTLISGAMSVTLLVWRYQQEIVASRLSDLSIPLLLQIRQENTRGATLSSILEVLKQTAEQANIRILLVTTNGRVLADTDPSVPWQGTTVVFPEAAPASAAALFRGRYVGPDGTLYQYVATRIGIRVNSPQERPIQPAIILADRDPQPIDTFQNLLPRFVPAALAAVIASFIFGMTFARWIYRPIKRLTDATDAVAKGDYRQQVPIDGPTEVATLAARFNMMSREVESTRQSMKDFVFDVSHELKTPLTAISGFIEATLDGTASDPVARQHALTIARDQTRRLQRLVAELLDFARLESGQAAMARQPVDLTEVLGQCAEVLEFAAEDRGVELQVRIDPGLAVLGDEDRLEQVFTNLLDNAVRHTPRAGRVDLVAFRREAEVVVAVTDTGTGIPPEHINRLFDRFYRASLRQDGGTGLGLAITRQIVLDHGGTIGVRSAEGTGTTFEVCLPVLAGSLPAPLKRSIEAGPNGPAELAGRLLR